MSESVGNDLISGIDRAWLEMDDARNPMVVAAIMELDQVRNVEMLVQSIVDTLFRYPRFRQRADDSHHPPMWRDDGEPLLAYHVHIFHLSEDAPAHDLRHAVTRELGTELDRSRPLWRMTVFIAGSDRVTILFRAHHALADGMALVRVLFNLTQAGGDPFAPHARRAADHGPLSGLIRQLGVVNRQLEFLRRELRADLRHPSRVAEQLQEAREVAGAVRRVLALPDDNPASLRRSLSGVREVAWSQSLSFAPIRQRARKLGVKVNDLFMAALAGAFGRYLSETEARPLRYRSVRVSVPVNLREQVDDELGNNFGLLLVDLPVGIEDWRQRLMSVAGQMDDLKRSPEARAVLTGLALAGHLPVPLEKQLVNLVSGKAAAVVSNLPGPEQRLRIAGARLCNLVFWPPQAGGIGIGISLFSYAGRVAVGVSSDKALIEDPQRLIAAFEAEMQKIVHPRKHAQLT